MGELSVWDVLQQIGGLIVVSPFVVAVCEFDACETAVAMGIGLLEILECLEGVGLLHTAVTSFYQKGEGIRGNGFHHLLFRKDLAPDGESRQKGEA